MKILALSAALMFSFCMYSNAQVTAPAPYGLIPKTYQLKVLEMERYALMHFTPTTFENKEWGYGNADPKIFNPSKFDASQIVHALQQGGFKGLTVVAKHHDGFCLWPTASTDYNISQSPFRKGKGDLVLEIKNALDKAGMKLGIYCSPWDRNNTHYANKKYVTDVFYKQLRELYTRYGTLFTVFFDGANGGDGYYGGTNEKRKINAAEYYEYDKIFKMARELQPNANIFSDIGPDLRWVGNEHGSAAETSWATFTPIGKNGLPAAPGAGVDDRNLGSGTRNGSQWTPAECDVPLRPGWFYHANQEADVRTPAKLMEIYYASVGRGATMDLGIAPTTEGILCEGDVDKLKKFGVLITKTFAKNLAQTATVKASNTRGASKKFSPQLLLDNDRYSYWASDDAITTPSVEFSFPTPVRFNVIRLRENIKLGQRIEEVAIDTWDNNDWKQTATATSIGANRLIRLPNYISTKKIRLRVVKSPVCIALSDFGLFAEPEELVTGNTGATHNTALNSAGWKAVGFEHAIDNNPQTISVLNSTASVEIDFGKTQTFRSIGYLPRQDKQRTGLISRYTYYYSKDGKNWISAAKGEFANIANNPILQTTTLPAPITARYLKLHAEETTDGSAAVVAEIQVYK